MSKYLFNDSGYCYELRKMVFDHIVKNDDIFFKYLQDKPLTRYVEKMRSVNSSGRKIELIGLSSLFEINIIVFTSFNSGKTSISSGNNYTDKKVALFKEDKEQYSLLIHKTMKVKYSIYKRQQIVEINEESKYCESPIQEKNFVQEKSTTLAYKFYEDAFIYLKDGTYPSKLIQSFTDKAVLKSRKKNFRELVKKDRRYKLIEVIEKGHNTLCLSKN